MVTLTWQSRIVWPLRTRRLVRSYVRGQQRLTSEKRQSETDAERECVQEIADIGVSLARGVCETYRAKHATSGLRVMVHQPPDGAGRVWFDDLAACLRHCGIATHTLHWEAANIRAEAFEFKPNVLLSFDSPTALRHLDLNFLTDFKATHGLFRLFCTHDPAGIFKRHALSPKEVVLKPEDAWRLDLLRRGQSADAFFCLMDSAYYDLFFKPWHPSNCQYFSSPMAANPLEHFPRVVGKDLDWALATNNCDWGLRAELTERYMHKIISQYRGILVGAAWGPNVNAIPHDQVPALMARARICPNPRIDFSMAYPTEIGGKCFEVSAMGGFVLASRTAALHKHFRSDEIASAADEREFNELFDYFVRRPRERQAYTMRAMKRVFSEHTYFQRIDGLLKFIASCSGRPLGLEGLGYR